MPQTKEQREEQAEQERDAATRSKAAPPTPKPTAPQTVEERLTYVEQELAAMKTKVR